MSGRFVPANGSSSIFSFKSVYRAYLNCRKNKRCTINALKFELQAIENILKLTKELKSKTYHPLRSILFATTKPKRREIFAADFRDRIVHHLLVEYLEHIFEPIFIYDSYACRKNKGTHAAKERLHKFTRQITKNGRVKAYYLQLDIKDFFPSISKDILFELISKKVSDPDVLWLTKLIIFWDCTKSYVTRGDGRLLKQIPAHKSLFGRNNEYGLPIGNLTSQFFANVILNELDQFVKHELKTHYYLRYVDDFVILSPDPSQLRAWQAQIEEFLQSKLKLRLHPKRRKLLPISNGIDFLGYIIRPKYVLVRRRVVNNLKEKIKQFSQTQVKDFRKFQDMLSSYLGHFKLANSYRLIKELGLLR